MGSKDVKRMSASVVNWLLGFNKARHLFLTARPALFIFLITSTAIATFGYKLRTQGIFACPSHGYTADTYLAFCSSAGYGDYDHAAFWFELEPLVQEFASAADVLFLGNSRMQVGFSSPAVADAISALKARYYLLGFVYETHVFEQELLNRFEPQARAYVVSLDGFFQPQSGVSKDLMNDPTARSRNTRKHFWQLVHRPFCDVFSVICGDQYAVFRSRTTGVWQAGGGGLPGKPVSYDDSIDWNTVEEEIASGREFLSRLPVQRECVIPTLVPTVGTRIRQADAIAKALKIDLVAPRIDGLGTFDGSHLDRSSAERWTRAFFQEAGPRIRRCLDQPLASR